VRLKTATERPKTARKASVALEGVCMQVRSPIDGEGSGCGVLHRSALSIAVRVGA
jgi:hypothetical protein